MKVYVHEKRVYEVEVDDWAHRLPAEVIEKVTRFANSGQGWWHKSGWGQDYPVKRISWEIERVYIPPYLPPRSKSFEK